MDVTVLDVIAIDVTNVKSSEGQKLPFTASNFHF